MNKDLNKHRQVKGVDSETNDINTMLGFPELVLYNYPMWENLIKKCPNDADLGRKIREAILSWKERWY